MKRPAALLAALCLSLFLVLSAAAQEESPPIPVDQYWDFVRETRQRLEASKTLAAGNELGELATLAEQWQAIRSVQLPAGEIVPVDHAYLVALLMVEPPDQDRAIALLDALLEAHQRWPQEVFDASHLAALQRVLERPEFQWRQVDDSLLQQIQDAFWRMFWSLMNRIFGGRAASISIRFVEQGLFLASALVLAVVLSLVFKSVMKTMAPEAQAPGEEGDELLSAEAAFVKAQMLSQAGDYRTAVRYMYLSALLELEERGLFRYDRSKTNREYLRSLAGSPELASKLQRVVEVFDRVWYGYQPLQAPDFERYAQQVLELRQVKP